MKFTSIAALCWTARLASAATGHVYITDSARPQSQPRGELRSLQPVPARLVLAQRAGVEDYHSADLGDESVREAINEYGVRTTMFEDNSLQNGRRQRAMILVEGGEDAEGEMLSTV